MGRKHIVLIAIDLVAAWDAGGDDAALRGALIEAVREFTRPPTDITCAVNQGRSQAQWFGGGHYLLPSRAEKLVECLRMGLSHRETAKEVGCNRNTIRRYESLNGPFVCPCGRERQHQGWCAARLKRSPRRQAFLAGWFEQSVANGTRRRAAPSQPIIIEPRIVDANWPYLKGTPKDSAALLNAVNDAVSHAVPEQQRADVCQNLLLAILEGDVNIADIATAATKFLTQYHKDYHERFGTLSLEAPISGDDERTIGERI